MKKVHKQDEDCESCYILDPYILTVLLLIENSQNRDLKYNRIHNLHLVYGYFFDPYSPFLNYQFFNYLCDLELCETNSPSFINSLILPSMQEPTTMIDRIHV